MALKVAVLGCGVVGTEVVRRIHDGRAELAERVGAPLELVGIAVRHPEQDRGLDVDPDLWTDDALGLVERDDVDIVVELLGGLEPARSLVVTAMARGASVVSANKALLAAHGPQLHATAAHHGVDLLYEAAVAAAVPVLGPLRDSLCGDRIARITGVVNGTTNYILDQMTRTGGDYAAALSEAIDRGYAEADPSADVEGTDAAAKAVILASLAFHTWPDPARVHQEGITGVTAQDVADARACGRVVKLVALLEQTCESDGSRQVLARVQPTMVDRRHPLADVSGADNAVLVEAHAAGLLLFTGAGAGGLPTSGPVLGDLVTAARRRLQGRFQSGPLARRAPAGPIGTHTDRGLRSRHHLRIPIQDLTAAQAAVSVVLARANIAITSIRTTVDARALLILTADTEETTLRHTLGELAALPSVSAMPRSLPLLDAHEDQ
ncbi:homoserine dehydrogenase [Streptomyces fulvorobeus]|uniref:Homoserine dehydrogenase n=1 Tax=Streptomyces fulvorobeus TaxID=284028 RepID=A0A7J0C4A1_9ACTN|nr:homoserine dehydrogenase [Streptomyces fulvorobeus]NYE40620.1 homoserine dehydrogenase [Streptomyces fulvorobeus]GFM96917.1 homoserine dehydrogenase [Streptomyces fulvorobeus]